MTAFLNCFVSISSCFPTCPFDWVCKWLSCSQLITVCWEWKRREFHCVSLSMEFWNREATAGCSDWGSSSAPKPDEVPEIWDFIFDHIIGFEAVLEGGIHLNYAVMTKGKLRSIKEEPLFFVACSTKRWGWLFHLWIVVNSWLHLINRLQQKWSQIVSISSESCHLCPYYLGKSSLWITLLSFLRIHPPETSQLLEQGLYIQKGTHPHKMSRERVTQLSSNQAAYLWDPRKASDSWEPWNVRVVCYMFKQTYASEHFINRSSVFLLRL